MCNDTTSRDFWVSIERDFFPLEDDRWIELPGRAATSAISASATVIFALNQEA